MALRDLDDRLAERSYYAATTPREQRFAPLQGDCATDVAVVGGGLAGLSAALELAERGFKVVVLEAREVGSGASGRNGGQAIHGLACDPAEVEAQLGPDDARRIWDMTIEAVALVRDRCKRLDIACEWRDGFMAAAVNARKARALRRWADHVETAYQYPLHRIEPARMPEWIASPRYHSAVHDPASGHLHPLKYCMGLAQAAHRAGVVIHEHTAVQRLHPGTPVVLQTTRGPVSARWALLAGNVYLEDLAPQLQSRIMPVGTYISCTEPIEPARLQALIPSGSAICDTNFVLDYFRPTADHRLMYGGRVSYSTLTPGQLESRMQRRMRATFPSLRDVRIEYTWGGFVDITRNRAPDFGRLRLGGSPNVYYLQGFSGHGLALTGLAGQLVAQAIAGDATRFDTFARIRHRPFPGGKWLRTPALVLGMAWYRLRDAL